ncbi:NAD(P)/FAD-dependent oxidoreductase [Nocardioides sp. YIM 152315]|uniref:flavin-containing monooxygenase n=1 Tax=Nocardioides sp. YIM 152315 TaxID=3031760 RepID=UPI0023DC64F7|nr:NAD(P)/FAD-dependent oxidoreductase [Nocardioides sp. YIM 152315]MDF1605799.1 NAD(P)/FAD-dependent oxidoreductase [Nocardioides sp. YIM 152315]
MDDRKRVLVVGSGPAGLATAAALVASGVPTTVFERGDAIGAAWAGRYDALRFNTSRLNSALPGAPFPRDFGQFPTRDQYVAYLQDYGGNRGLLVETRVEVTRIERTRDEWLVHTSKGERRTPHVVVATGIMNRPRVPEWAIESGFQGELIHSASYRNATPFVGHDVLVVGAGSSGLEIAHELATRGARRVRLSVRNSPNILLRVVGGLPSDLPAPLLLHLPTGLVDRMLLAMQRVVNGDLAPYGLPRPAEGPISQLKRRGAGTAIVDTEVLDRIRDGTIEVVPAVARLDAQGARLVGGAHIEVDSVIVAAGYCPGLESLVGHLGVLDKDGMPRDGVASEQTPGLHFVGYVYRPGLTRYVGRTARAVARRISQETAELASVPSSD